MESTQLAYRENAGKGEEKVLIWRFRRWKLNGDDDEEDEVDDPTFCLIFISTLDIVRSEKRRSQKTCQKGRIYFLA